MAGMQGKAQAGGTTYQANEGVRSLIAEVIEREGLDGFLKLAQLVCGIKARERETAGDERERDRWRARVRHLSSWVVMAALPEGRNARGEL